MNLSSRDMSIADFVRREKVDVDAIKVAMIIWRLMCDENEERERERGCTIKADQGHDEEGSRIAFLVGEEKDSG